MTAQPSRAPMWAPVQIESEIRDIANQIAKNVAVVGRLHEEFLEADRVYDLAYAEAYLGAQGSIPERKYRAEKQTTSLRRSRDVADAAYQLAKNRSRAMESQLSGDQTISASIRAQYLVAGRGEEA